MLHAHAKVGNAVCQVIGQLREQVNLVGIERIRFFRCNYQGTEHLSLHLKGKCGNGAIAIPARLLLKTSIFRACIIQFGNKSSAHDRLPGADRRSSYRAALYCIGPSKWERLRELNMRTETEHPTRRFFLIVFGVHHESHPVASGVHNDVAHIV